MRKISLIYIFLFSLTLLKGQDLQDKVNQLVEDYVSQNEDSNIDAEVLYETFYDLYDNPININTATFSDLESLPFLAPHHINALLDYIKRYGAIQTIFELQGVYDFDRQLIESIAPFVCFEAQEQQIQRRMYLKNEILVRSTTVVEDQEGYTRPDIVSRYLGPKYSALVKYKGSLGNKYSWHITAEQDRGEPWFNHTYLTDFASIGLQYSGDKWLKEVIVGDYRMCFGQGLVMNNNFGYGKSSQVLDVIQKGRELNRFTSSYEALYLRGAATQMKFGDFDLYFGLSSHKADASIDTIDGRAVITSFPETGLHRTSSEVSKYKTAHVNDAIAHLDYTYKNFKVGATFTGQNLSLPFQKDESMYSFHSPKYKNYFNMSADYKWNMDGVMLFGELASDQQGGIAALQGVLVYPSSHVSMSAVYRYFSKDYFAFYGQGFGESGNINNEEGLYLGTHILISKGWSLDTYFDWYRFPWLRYGIARPTYGYDVLFQPNYVPSRNANMYWRFKYEEKEANLNTDSPTNNIQNTKRFEFRYHLSAKVSDNVTLQSRVATTQALHLKDEYGFLIFQDITAKFFQQRLSTTLRYALYNTTSYESRIYAYESDVLYLSSIPAFYGRGSRAFINASYKINNTFTVYFKASYSKAFDREEMGSGLDLINADHKTDLHLQLRIKI